MVLEQCYQSIPRAIPISRQMFPNTCQLYTCTTIGHRVYCKTAMPLPRFYLIYQSVIIRKNRTSMDFCRMQLERDYATEISTSSGCMIDYLRCGACSKGRTRCRQVRQPDSSAKAWWSRSCSWRSWCPPASPHSAATVLEKKTHRYHTCNGHVVSATASSIFIEILQNITGIFSHSELYLHRLSWSAWNKNEINPRVDFEKVLHSVISELVNSEMVGPYRNQCQAACRVHRSTDYPVSSDISSTESSKSVTREYYDMQIRKTISDAVTAIELWSELRSNTSNPLDLTSKDRRRHYSTSVHRK